MKKRKEKLVMDGVMNGNEEEVWSIHDEFTN